MVDAGFDNVGPAELNFELVAVMGGSRDGHDVLVSAYATEDVVPQRDKVEAIDLEGTAAQLVFGEYDSATVRFFCADLTYDVTALATDGSPENNPKKARSDAIALREALQC